MNGTGHLYQKESVSTYIIEMRTGSVTVETI